MGGIEGRGYCHALVPLNGRLHTRHKPWLAPYTSRLHVKGRLLYSILTTHLTCLRRKKGEISLPVSAFAPSQHLTNQLAGHFSRKDDFFTLGLNIERQLLQWVVCSRRVKQKVSKGFWLMFTRIWKRFPRMKSSSVVIIRV